MPQKSMFCESCVPVTREKEYYYPFDPCVHPEGTACESVCWWISAKCRCTPCSGKIFSMAWLNTVSQMAALWASQPAIKFWPVTGWWVTFVFAADFFTCCVFDWGCCIWRFSLPIVQWVFSLQLLLCIAVNTFNWGSSLTVVEIIVFYWSEFKSNWSVHSCWWTGSPKKSCHAYAETFVRGWNAHYIFLI